MRFLGAPVQRSFIVSFAVSLVILVVGVAWTHQIWKKTNQRFHELAHMEDGLKDLRNAAHATAHPELRP